MGGIKNIRLSDQIIEQLRKMITEENFSPGDKFYSENQLTAKLKVSRSSVREAVRMLEATGHVHVKHGKGIFISSPPRSEDEAFREWLATNREAVFDHYEVRLIIESKAASYAAARATDADVIKLEEICTEYEIAHTDGSATELLKADERFHLHLAEISGNKTMHFLMKTMTTRLPEGWISSINIPKRAAITSKEHRAILNAVKACSAKRAEEAMVIHLQNAVADIRRYYNE